MSAADLITALRARGFALRVTADRLEVRPAGALTRDDRAAIRSRLPDLIATLAGEVTPPQFPTPGPAGEPWNLRTALRLMEAADTEVERLGVDGRHPAVAAGAAMVCDAHATQDPETVRFAVSQFSRILHRLAAGVHPETRTGCVTRSRPRPGQPPVV